MPIGLFRTYIGLLGVSIGLLSIHSHWSSGFSHIVNNTDCEGPTHVEDGWLEPKSDRNSGSRDCFNSYLFLAWIHRIHLTCSMDSRRSSTHTHTQKHALAHTCTRTRTHTLIYIHTRTHAHTHTHIHAHTCTHAHTHTHARTHAASAATYARAALLFKYYTCLEQTQNCTTWREEANEHLSNKFETRVMRRGWEREHGERAREKEGARERESESERSIDMNQSRTRVR